MTFSDFIIGLVVLIAMSLVLVLMVEADDKEADARRERIEKHIAQWDSERGE